MHFFMITVIPLPTLTLYSVKKINNATASIWFCMETPDKVLLLHRNYSPYPYLCQLNLLLFKFHLHF